MRFFSSRGQAVAGFVFRGTHRPGPPMRCCPRGELAVLLLSLSTVLSLAVGGAWAVAAPPEATGLRLLEESQAALAELAEAVTPTVVGVAAIRPGVPPGARPGRFPRPGAGSGVVIHEDGYIVTNHHVITPGVAAEVRFADQSTRVAVLVAGDPETDLALLKVEADRKLQSARFGDSRRVKVGHWVVAVGNPFGLERTVTLGIVSGLGRENMNLARYENFIQIDASINPGNSGGPLFNLRGEVIGINTAMINFGQGVGFAIPSNLARRIIEQLQTSGRVVRGWLGVGIQPLPSSRAAGVGGSAGHGVLVTEVVANAPAARAGLQAGDIITRIGPERLASPAQLVRVVAGFAPGDTVVVHVLREGTRLRLPVLLGAKPSRSVGAAVHPPSAVVTWGLDVAPVPEAEEVARAPTTGILVVRVVPGSVAHAEGLRKGDVIQEVNRAAVPTMQALRHRLEAVPPGSPVLLRIRRVARTFFVVLHP